MGRRAREGGVEQLNAEVPIGGRERANVLAEKLAGGNRSKLVWRLLEAAEVAAERGIDLETIEESLRGGKPISEEIQRQAKVGRAVLKALEVGKYSQSEQESTFPALGIPTGVVVTKSD